MKVQVDKALVEAVIKITGIQDESAACEFALREMIRRMKKIKALEDFAGSVEFYEGFDSRDEARSGDAA